MIELKWPADGSMPQEPKRRQMIELHDSPLVAFAKISEGYAPAVPILLELFQTGAATDPDSTFGNMSPIFDFENIGIYGPQVYKLWECCSKNIQGVQTVLRAQGLGLISHHEMLKAIETGTQININALLTAVQEKLPAFGRVGKDNAI